MMSANISNQVVEDSLRRAASVIDMDKQKQETFVHLVKDSLSEGVRHAVKNEAEKHQQRALNKNWRPISGWIVVAGLLTKVFIEPTLNAFGVNFTIPMETIYVLLGMGGINSIGRTVEKIKK